MTDTAFFGYLERVAQSLLMGNHLPPYPALPSFTIDLDGFVEPKERQRTGKAGHHYTPADTRRYEAYVKEAADRQMTKLGLRRFERPVVIHLEVRDQIHSQTPDWMRQLMAARLVFEHTGGDLDNKEKAVLDALNRVVYRDDRLVVQVYKFRIYAPKAGFRITVTPTGFTKNDLLIIEKLYKNGQANGSAEGNGGQSR